MEEASIATAAAYPWAPNEQQIAAPLTRKRKASGIAVLHQALNDSRTSDRAKEILMDLLGGDFTEDTTNETRFLATTALTKQSTRAPVTINPNAPMSDEQIIGMAQEGQLSLLGSVVRVIGESTKTPVSTKQVLKTCILAVPPGDIPGDMDAKDMVIAALLFLSSTQTSDYWNLPLIRPTQEEDVDLEQRTYELVESPTASQLQWLDTAFLSSTDEFLAREKFCPRLAPNEEDPLLRKGIIPARAMPMTAAAKRKATLAAKAAAASPTPP